MILKTEGIVLKTYDLRETSRIAVFFTKDCGKMKGVLKGIRRDSKKYGSSLEKFSINDIVYYWHSNSEIHLVGQCDLKEYFFSIRQDLRRMVAAEYILELIDSIMPLEEENKEVYRLTLNTLDALQDIYDIHKLIHIFQIKVLNLSGFRPHIDSCLLCQKHILENARFSQRLGGLICPACHPKDPAAHVISQGAVASILHIERSDWKGMLRLGLAAPIKKELKYILNNFLAFHLERHLKSERYLYQKL